MSSELFRKSVLNRLPAMPPTRAPWIQDDEQGEEEMEELDDEEGDNLGTLPSRMGKRSVHHARPASCAIVC
jgi:protein phosphatase methylesterase 1